jgi:hypothetical protein
VHNSLKIWVNVIEMHSSAKSFTPRPTYPKILGFESQFVLLVLLLLQIKLNNNCPKLLLLAFLEYLGLNTLLQKVVDIVLLLLAFL